MAANEFLRWKMSLDDAKQQLHVLEQKQRAAREEVNKCTEELQRYNRTRSLTIEQTTARQRIRQKLDELTNEIIGRKKAITGLNQKIYGTTKEKMGSVLPR